MSTRLGVAQVNLATNTAFVDVVTASHHGATISLVGCLGVAVGTTTVIFGVKRGGRTYRVTKASVANSVMSVGLSYLPNSDTSLPLAVDTGVRTLFSLYLNAGDVFQVAAASALSGAQAVDVFANYDDGRS